MPALKHFHTYERLLSRGKTGKYWNVYKCVDPECTHFQKRELLPGKRVQCKCGNTFILDDPRYFFQKAELKCMECSKTKKAKASNLAASVMDAIFSPQIEPFQIDSTETVLKIPVLSPEQGELKIGPEENQLELEKDVTESVVDWDD